MTREISYEVHCNIARQTMNATCCCRFTETYCGGSVLLGRAYLKDQLFSLCLKDNFSDLLSITFNVVIAIIDAISKRVCGNSCNNHTFDYSILALVMIQVKLKIHHANEKYSSVDTER